MPSEHFQTSETFKRHLTSLAAALDAEPLNYDTLIAIIRELNVPAKPSSDGLGLLFDCCHRLLDFTGNGLSKRMRSGISESQAGHLQACAGEMIEHAMYDPNANSRAWIQERIAWHNANNREVPKDYLNADLPPALYVPWDLETAKSKISPLLRCWENQLPANPTAHFNLCWKVLHDGYPVFRTIVSDWMQDLERRGLGLPRTVQAFAKADELLKLANAAKPIGWTDCERDVLPLLRDPHPMIAAGAARYLGALYDEPDFTQSDGTAPLVAILDKLSSLEKHSAIASGAFICGFDSDCAGLHTLASHSGIAEAKFDIDKWILDIVSNDDFEPYLPNAQPLWFYIHEHYDTKPDMVAKLIGIGRPWIAMMCATEIRGRVDGMQPILERLANDPDPEISEACRYHLSKYYGA